MPRTIVAATPLSGHTLPLLRVAADLAAHGHEVTFVGGARFAERAEAAGATVRELTGAAGYDERRLAETMPEVVSLPAGPQRLVADITQLFADAVPDQHAALQELLAADPDQALVSDTTFLGGWPSALGVGRRPRRWVGVGITPLYLSSDDTTPFGPAPAGPGQDQVSANRAFNAAMDASIAAADAHLVDVLAGLGVTRPLPAAYLETCYLLPDVTAQPTVAAFEFPRRDLPASIRYVGALPPATSPSWVPPAWWPEAVSGRPVVVVTQGTLANDDLGELVGPTLEALAGQDVLVVAALGRPVEALAGPVPDNARVVEHVPFEHLLPHADVLVTNGGYGAVQQALAAGVPVVVAGTTEDKPAVAARVASCGVGIDLATSRPSPGQVREAVDRVRSDPATAVRVKAMADSYAAADGYAGVRALLEEPVAGDR